MKGSMIMTNIKSSTMASISHQQDPSSRKRLIKMFKVFVLFTITILAYMLIVNGSDPEIGIYEIKKGDFSVKVTNYGARIVSVFLPDEHGNVADVVLGYDTIDEYKNDTASFGAIVGRVANRIAGAQFTLNGKVYNLNANDGENTLHGGARGFSHRVWMVNKLVTDGPSPHITLSYHSADGEEGFPGEVITQVTYTLDLPYKLSITMTAKALNKPTPVNLAQHTYWNLGGHDSGTILSNYVQIFASQYTPVNENLIPTGEYKSVKNTAYNFLNFQTVKSQITKLPNGTKGFDINYVIDGTKSDKIKQVAIVESQKSGRRMKLSTNAPGVQFYTGNGIGDVKGKGGVRYHDFNALCLETQGFPDAVNQPNFPSTIVYPGKIYEHFMIFEFSQGSTNLHDIK